MCDHSHKKYMLKAFLSNQNIITKESTIIIAFFPYKTFLHLSILGLGLLVESKNKPMKMYGMEITRSAFSFTAYNRLKLKR